MRGPDVVVSVFVKLWWRGWEMELRELPLCSELILLCECSSWGVSGS